MSPAYITASIYLFKVSAILPEQFSIDHSFKAIELVSASGYQL